MIKKDPMMSVMERAGLIASGQEHPTGDEVETKLDRFLSIVKVWVERDGGDMDNALSWMYSQPTEHTRKERPPCEGVQHPEVTREMVDASYMEEIREADRIADFAAQPVQKPVAWIWKYANGEEEVVFVDIAGLNLDPEVSDVPSKVTPLYAAPPLFVAASRCGAVSIFAR